MSASELPGTSINGLLNSEPQPAKLPLPTESELEKSRGLLKELYAAEFAAARSFEERQSFLAHLMTEAEKIKDNSSDYHELLLICRKLAISLGNVPVAVSAVDRLHGTFALEDPMGLRLKTLEEIAANAKSDDVNQNLALGAEKLLLDAYENDQFPVALAALEVYKNATKGRLSKGEQNQIAATKEAMEEAKIMPQPVKALAYPAAIWRCLRFCGRPIPVPCQREVGSGPSDAGSWKRHPVTSARSP
ncbi:MAG: hypothetical protein U0894_09715 [Pirellulales bacterium]